MKTTTTSRPVPTRFISVELDEHEARVVYDLLQGFVNPESREPAGTFEQFVANLERALTAPIQEPEPIKEPAIPVISHVMVDRAAQSPAALPVPSEALAPTPAKKPRKAPPSPCPACGKAISAGAISRHYAVKHPGVLLPGEHACPEAGCTYRGASMSAVHMHRWRTHGLKAADTAAEPEPEALPEPESVPFIAIDAPVTVPVDELLATIRGGDVLRCACRRTYATAGALQSHIQRDHGGVEPTADEVARADADVTALKEPVHFPNRFEYAEQTRALKGTRL